MPKPPYLSAAPDIPQRHKMLILAVIAGLFLPFCNKALHIDDYGFLQMSQALTWSPLEPLQVWVLDTTHPLLLPYLYKALFPLTNANEALLHLAFLIFPVIAVFSLGSLHRTLFRPEAAQNTLFLIFFCSLPAFLVNAQTLMADVPTLAFSLLALACYVKALENRINGLAWLGGGSLCLAIFTSYQAALFIPLVFAYALSKRGMHRPLLASLALAPTIMLVWLAAVYLRHDMIPFFKGLPSIGAASGSAAGSVVADGFPLEALRGKLIFILALTGTSMLPILALRLIGSKPRPSSIGLGTILLALSFAAISLAEPSYPTIDRAFLSLFVTCGLIALGMAGKLCLAEFRSNPDKSRATLLSLWIGGVLLYNLFLLPFGSARYLLPALPAIMMLLFEQLRSVSAPSRTAKGAVIFLSLLFGASCSFADYRHADSYRKMSDEVTTFRENLNHSFDIWFVGDWGMGYYMTSAGAKKLSPLSTDPKRGDFIILPELPRTWVPALHVQRRSRDYATRDFISDIPLRLFNRHSKAGFYSHYAGLLPFAFSQAPDETFVILEVVE